MSLLNDTNKTPIVVATSLDRGEILVESAGVGVVSAGELEEIEVVRVTEIPPITSGLLNRLLRMADRYRLEGSLHQASELYFDLMDNHLGTFEAIQARNALLEIAEAHDASGERRQARSLYERLLASEEE